VARGSGTSGWPRGVPVWYYVVALDGNNSAAGSWAALASLNEAILKPPSDGTLGRLDGNYLGTYLAAMRLAASLGHREMLAILGWYESRAPAIGQKYLISPEPAQAASPQPVSPGDPQFRSATQRLPPRAGTYALATGVQYVVGISRGQSVAVSSSNETWHASVHGDKYC
jgi:hypothetical protein